MSATRFLMCGSHGRTPWSGQVICNACGSVWHLNVESPPTADGTCTCGESLVGGGGTARAICAQCYRQKKAEAALSLN